MSRHPSLEELLTLDDGEQRPEVLRHLEGCVGCGSRRRDLLRRRDELRALPLLRPKGDGWAVVRARVIASRRRRVLAGGALAAALLAFALAAAAILQKKAPSGAGPVDELAQLVQQSQRGEEKLRFLADPEVIDVASADAIVQMEDQIALVDECIAEIGTGLESRQALAVLWQTRVTLLDALAQMRNPAFARLTR